MEKTMDEPDIFDGTEVQRLKKALSNDKHARLTPYHLFAGTRAMKGGVRDKSGRAVDALHPL